MTDSAFTNNTFETATNLGNLGFAGNSFPGRTTARIFDFDSVGINFDPPFDFTTDIRDHFTFDPYLLADVRVTFNADSVGDFVNELVFVPVSGVSKVTGAIVGTWYGGVHDNDDEPDTEDKNFVQDQARDALDFYRGGGLGTATDFSDATWVENSFGGADAIWTLTGEPVVIRVFGLQGNGTTEEINEKNNIPEEVDYSFTIRPQSGLPDPASTLTRNYLNGYEDSEIVFGETGRDSWDARGPRDDFTVTVNSDGSILLQDSVYPEAPDTLTGFERIEFWDGNLAYDFDGNAGQAYRLYQAAFDRDPDAEGLGFWIDHYDDGNVNLVQMAEYFMQSEEFAEKYAPPGSLGDNDFLTLLYANVLDRTPDQAGFDFWSNQQAQGLTRAEMLQYFSESIENYQNVAAEIADGIWYI